MYIVSRCLLGVNCKYNGGNNLREDVVEFINGQGYVSVCPECAGGLKSPREPAEIFACQRESCADAGDGLSQGPAAGVLRVVNRQGEDLTDAFVRGAERSMEEVLEAVDGDLSRIEGAILKANSPSCGTGMIYDGTFTGTKIPGYGVFSELLRKQGVKLASEKNYRDILLGEGQIND